MRKILLCLGLFVGVFTGCTHQVSLRTQSSTLTYADKLPIKVGVYIPDEIKSLTVETPATGSACEGNSYPMEIGPYLSDAIINGIQTACAEVVPVRTQTAFTDDMKFIIVPRVNGMNTDLSFNESFFSMNFKGTFQGNLTCNVVDKSGKVVYSFAASGNGFNSGSGSSCASGTDALQRATESGLQQIADNIAQTLNSSTQVRQAMR